MKDILKPVQDIRKKSQHIREKEINVDEKVKIHLKRIARYIDSSSQRGCNNTSVFMANEFKWKEEIYDRVLKEILDKGYKTEYNDDKTIIEIFW